MLASPAPVWSVLYMAWRTLSVTLYTANLRGLGIRSITERLSLSPASSTRCLSSAPYGSACPGGRGIGLTLFRLNDTNDLVPVCTPAASVSVCSKCRWKHPAACLLAGACQRLWLFGDNGACGSSLALDISFSLTLQPPRRWQSHCTFPCFSAAERACDQSAKS
jgi:hypothetical protein